MKLKLTRAFSYQATVRKVSTIPPGIYDVPDEISEDLFKKIRRYGKSQIVQEKVAPENKVVRPPENKATLERSVRSRSTGSKSNKRDS